jgi:hypothetical protein
MEALMIELIDELIERLSKFRELLLEERGLDARIADKRKIEANLDATNKQATALQAQLSDDNIKLQARNNGLKAENSSIDAKIAGANERIAKLRVQFGVS